MLNIISKSDDQKQLVEIHNRPYLIDRIFKDKKIPISLFLHNDPQTMKVTSRSCTCSTTCAATCADTVLLIHCQKCFCSP